MVTAAVALVRAGYADVITNHDEDTLAFREGVEIGVYRCSWGGYWMHVQIVGQPPAESEYMADAEHVRLRALYAWHEYERQAVSA